VEGKLAYGRMKQTVKPRAPPKSKRNLKGGLGTALLVLVTFVGGLKAWANRSVMKPFPTYVVGAQIEPDTFERFEFIAPFTTTRSSSYRRRGKEKPRSQKAKQTIQELMMRISATKKLKHAMRLEEADPAKSRTILKTLSAEQRAFLEEDEPFKSWLRELETRISKGSNIDQPRHKGPSNTMLGLALLVAGAISAFGRLALSGVDLFHASANRPVAERVVHHHRRRSMRKKNTETKNPNPVLPARFADGSSRRAGRSDVGKPVSSGRSSKHKIGLTWEDIEKLLPRLVGTQGYLMEVKLNRLKENGTHVNLHYAVKRPEEERIRSIQSMKRWPRPSLSKARLPRVVTITVARDARPEDVLRAVLLTQNLPEDVRNSIRPFFVGLAKAKASHLLQESPRDRVLRDLERIFDEELVSPPQGNLLEDITFGQVEADEFDLIEIAARLGEENLVEIPVQLMSSTSKIAELVSFLVRHREKTQLSASKPKDSSLEKPRPSDPSRSSGSTTLSMRFDFGLGTLLFKAVRWIIGGVAGWISAVVRRFHGPPQVSKLTPSESDSKSTLYVIRPSRYDVLYSINVHMDKERRLNKRRARRQWNKMIRALKRQGARIIQFDQRSAKPDVVPDFVFTANAGLVVHTAQGKYFIPRRFRNTERKKEIPHNIKHFESMGYKIADVVSEDLAWEGEGDMLFLGEKIFGGYSLHEEHRRSDKAAHEQVAEALGKSQDLVTLELVDPRFYHLDTAFFPVDDEIVLYFPGAFTPEGVAAIERHAKRTIPISEADAKRFASNAITIGKTIIVNDGLGSGLKARLAEFGFSVVETPMSEFLKAGGSVKCCVLKLPAFESPTLDLRRYEGKKKAETDFAYAVGTSLLGTTPRQRQESGIIQETLYKFLRKRLSWLSKLGFIRAFLHSAIVDSFQETLDIDEKENIWWFSSTYRLTRLFIKINNKYAVRVVEELLATVNKSQKRAIWSALLINLSQPLIPIPGAYQHATSNPFMRDYIYKHFVENPDAIALYRSILQDPTIHTEVKEGIVWALILLDTERSVEILQGLLIDTDENRQSVPGMRYGNIVNLVLSHLNQAVLKRNFPRSREYYYANFVQESASIQEAWEMLRDKPAGFMVVTSKQPTLDDLRAHGNLPQERSVSYVPANRKFYIIQGIESRVGRYFELEKTVIDIHNHDQDILPSHFDLDATFKSGPNYIVSPSGVTKYMYFSSKNKHVLNKDLPIIKGPVAEPKESFRGVILLEGYEHMAVIPDWFEVEFQTWEDLKRMDKASLASFIDFVEEAGDDAADIADTTEKMDSPHFLTGIPLAEAALKERNLNGQNVLVRANLNVPFSTDGEISDDARLQQILPVARLLWQEGANVILIGHLGGIEKGKDDRKSAERIVQSLRKLFQQDEELREIPTDLIIFHPESISKEGLKIQKSELSTRGIHILENVRFAWNFERGETESLQRKAFAKGLVALSDGIFIFDAFGDIGSKGASVEDVPSYAREVYIGPAMAKEFGVLQEVLQGFDALVFGGAKLEKVDLLKGLVTKSLSPQGFALIGSGPSAELNENQQKLLEELRGSSPDRILTAIDYSDHNKFDIGPQTLERFLAKLETLKSGQTVLLNGTMGYMEHESGLYKVGTEAVLNKLKELAKRGVRIVVVGGNASETARSYSLAQEPNVILFTGGGVPLKILAGEELVGLKALRLAIERNLEKKDAVPDSHAITPRAMYEASRRFQFRYLDTEPYIPHGFKMLGDILLRVVVYEYLAKAGRLTGPPETIRQQVEDYIITTLERDSPETTNLRRKMLGLEFIRFLFSSEELVKLYNTPITTTTTWTPARNKAIRNILKALGYHPDIIEWVIGHIDTHEKASSESQAISQQMRKLRRASIDKSERHPKDNQPPTNLSTQGGLAALSLHPHLILFSTIAFWQMAGLPTAVWASIIIGLINTVVIVFSKYLPRSYRFNSVVILALVVMAYFMNLIPSGTALEATGWFATWTEVIEKTILDWEIVWRTFVVLILFGTLADTLAKRSINEKISTKGIWGALKAVTPQGVNDFIWIIILAPFPYLIQVIVHTFIAVAINTRILAKNYYSQRKEEAGFSVEKRRYEMFRLNRGWSLVKSFIIYALPAELRGIINPMLQALFRLFNRWGLHEPPGTLVSQMWLLRRIQYSFFGRMIDWLQKKFHRLISKFNQTKIWLRTYQSLLRLWGVREVIKFLEDVVYDPWAYSVAIMMYGLVWPFIKFWRWIIGAADRNTTHNFNLTEQLNAAKRFKHEPLVATEFKFNAETGLAVNQYLKDAGLITGPPGEFALASLREGKLIWNIKGGEEELRRILTLELRLDLTQAERFIEQIKIHEARPTEEEGIQAQRVAVIERAKRMLAAEIAEREGRILTGPELKRLIELVRTIGMKMQQKDMATAVGISQCSFSAALYAGGKRMLKIRIKIQRYLRSLAAKALGQPPVGDVDTPAKSVKQREHIARPHAPAPSEAITKRSLLEEANDLKAKFAELKSEGGEKIGVRHLIDLSVKLFVRAVEEALADPRIHPQIKELIGGVPTIQQIDAAILLLENKNMVGMLPSEGKTLVVGLAAYLKALMGQRVEVHGWSVALSARDAQVIAAILERLGIKVGLLANQAAYKFSYLNGTMPQPAWPHLTPFATNYKDTGIKRRMFHQNDIIYGAYNEMIFLWMLDWSKFTDQFLLHATPMPSWVILEESDTPLLDGMDEPLAIFSRLLRLAGLREKIYRRIYEFSLTLLVDEDYQIHKGGVIFLKGGEEEIVQKLKKNLKASDISLPALHIFFRTNHLGDLLKAALEARWLFHRDKNYYLKEGVVIIRDEQTGEGKETHRWARGIHTFIEIKENVSLREETIIDSVMTPYYFYKNIPSLSAVIGIVNEQEKNLLQTLYGVKIYILPPAHINNRRDLPEKYFLAQEEKHTYLVRLIAAVHKYQYPILVNAQDPIEAKRVHELLIEQHPEMTAQIRIIYGRGNEEESRFWNSMGQAGVITIAAQVASRGLEIKLEEALYRVRLDIEPIDDIAISPVAGLFVISTHHNGSERVEQQVRGRAGRRGKPGVVQVIDHLVDNEFLRRYAPEELDEFLKGDLVNAPNPLRVAAIKDLFTLARNRRSLSAHINHAFLEPLFRRLIEAQLAYVKAARREVNPDDRATIRQHRKILSEYVHKVYQAIARQEKEGAVKLLSELESTIHDLFSGTTEKRNGPDLPSGRIPAISFVLERLKINPKHQAWLEQVLFWSINLALMAVWPSWLATLVTWSAFFFLHFVRTNHMPKPPPLSGLIVLVLVNTLPFLFFSKIYALLVSFVLTTIFHHWLNKQLPLQPYEGGVRDVQPISTVLQQKRADIDVHDPLKETPPTYASSEGISDEELREAERQLAEAPEEPLTEEQIEDIVGSVLFKTSWLAAELRDCPNCVLKLLSENRALELYHFMTSYPTLFVRNKNNHPYINVKELINFVTPEELERIFIEPDPTFGPNGWHATNRNTGRRLTDILAPKNAWVGAKEGKSQNKDLQKELVLTQQILTLITQQLSKRITQNNLRPLSRIFLPLFRLRARKKRMSLANYFQFLRKGIPQNKSEQAYLLSTFEESFIGRIEHTSFFRYVQEWELISFLEYLIDSKWKNQDLKIRARSIGASTGQEPYSIAILLYWSLEKFYKKLKKQREVQESFPDWLKRWSIVIHAYDVNLENLLSIHKAIYKTNHPTIFIGEFDSDRSPNKMFSGLRIKQLFERHSAGYRIRKPLRQWVRPIFVDLYDSNQWELLADGVYEINFAMNIFDYVGNEVTLAVLQLFYRQRSPKYSSLVVINESLDDQPLAVRLQPHGDYAFSESKGEEFFSTRKVLSELFYTIVFEHLDSNCLVKLLSLPQQKYLTDELELERFAIPQNIRFFEGQLYFNVNGDVLRNLLAEFPELKEIYIEQRAVDGKTVYHATHRETNLRLGSIPYREPAWIGTHNASVAFTDVMARRHDLVKKFYAKPKIKSRDSRVKRLVFENEDDLFDRSYEPRDFVKSRKLGLVAWASIGEVVLMELGKKEQGLVYSLGHFYCISCAIRAHRGNKEVIGHAHIYPETDSQGGIPGLTLERYKMLLQYLTDPSNGYSDIQIILGAGTRILRSSLEHQMFQEATRNFGIRLEIIQRGDGTVASTFTTKGWTAQTIYTPDVAQPSFLWGDKYEVVMEDWGGMEKPPTERPLASCQNCLTKVLPAGIASELVRILIINKEENIRYFSGIKDPTFNVAVVTRILPAEYLQRIYVKETAVDGDQKIYHVVSEEESAQANGGKPLSLVSIENQEQAWVGARQLHRFDLEATIKYIIAFFEREKDHRKLPTQRELSEALGPHQFVFSYHSDEILRNLRRRIKEKGFDASLRKRIERAVNLWEDLIGTTGEYIIGLFKQNVGRKKFPTRRELSKALGPHQFVFWYHSQAILEYLKRRMGEGNFDTKLKDRIQLAINLREDVASTTAQYIIELFEKEKERQKLPSQNELAKALGPSQNAFSRRFERIIRELRERIHAQGFEVKLKERIERAIEQKRKKNQGIKFHLESAVLYIRLLFAEDNERRQLPTSGQLAAALRINSRILSGHFEEMIEILKEHIHVEGFDTTLRERITRAMQLRENLVAVTVAYIIELFATEVKRRKLPTLAGLSQALGPGQKTFAKHLEKIIENLTKRIGAKGFDVSLGKRMKRAINARRRNVIQLTAKHIVKLFENENDRKELPCLKDLSKVLGLSQEILSRHFDRILNSLLQKTRRHLRDLKERIEEAIWVWKVRYRHASRFIAGIHQVEFVRGRRVVGVRRSKGPAEKIIEQERVEGVNATIKELSIEEQKLIREVMDILVEEDIEIDDGWIEKVAKRQNLPPEKVHQIFEKIRHQEAIIKQREEFLCQNCLVRAEAESMWKTIKAVAHEYNEKINAKELLIVRGKVLMKLIWALEVMKAKFGTQMEVYKIKGKDDFIVQLLGDGNILFEFQPIKLSDGNMLTNYHAGVLVSIPRNLKNRLGKYDFVQFLRGIPDRAWVGAEVSPASAGEARPPDPSDSEGEKKGPAIDSETIERLLESNLPYTLRELASAFKVSLDDAQFKEALLAFVRTIPKSILHEHASGLIYAEHLLEYLLDDENEYDKTLESSERIRRKAAHQEARRRFVLTVTQGHSASSLQEHPINPSLINQSEADRVFKNILGIPQQTPLTRAAISFGEAAERLRTYLIYPRFLWGSERLERIFAVIRAVTDSHPSFRFELIKRGILKQFQEDNLRDIEITSFHGHLLRRLIEQLVEAEREVNNQINVSVLKAFRRDQLRKIIERAKNDRERKKILRFYSGLSLEKVKERILKKIIKSDYQLYGLDATTVRREFEEALDDITHQLRREKEDRVTIEDIRERLIFAYEARKLARKEIDEFEKELNALEASHPLYRKRVGGIVTIGDETDYISWISTPILRKAHLMGLKRSSYVGGIRNGGDSLRILQRIKREILLGVERLVDVAILSEDFEENGSLDETTRLQAKELQDEIFSLLREKGIHVAINLTNPLINVFYHHYRSHMVGKLLEKKVSSSINPGMSSVFMTSPSMEITEVWLANPDIPYFKLRQIMREVKHNRFYQSIDEVKRRLEEERQKVLIAQEGFKVPAVTVFGSARIPEGHPQYELSLKLGAMAWERRLTLRTGAGPSVMEWPLKGYIEAREKFIQSLKDEKEREAYRTNLPEVMKTQGIRILLPFEQETNPFVEKVYHFWHFVFRKLALHLRSLGVIAMHGGLGTIDEIFETWRRERSVALVGKQFYEPLLEAWYVSWEKAGLTSFIKTQPYVTDSLEEALEGMVKPSQESYTETIDKTSTQKAIEQTNVGLSKLSQLPRAVVIIGHVENNVYGRQILETLTKTVSQLFQMGVPVRVSSRALIFDTVLRVARKMRAEDKLQTVLYHWAKDKSWTPDENYLAHNYPNNTILVDDDSTHQLLLSYDARGYIFLPGGVGTSYKLFDIVCAMQTGKIRRKPIVLMGRSFWGRIMRTLKQILEGHDPPTVSPGDLEIMRVADSVREILKILSLNKVEKATHRKEREADDSGFIRQGGRAWTIFKEMLPQMRNRPYVYFHRLEKVYKQRILDQLTRLLEKDMSFYLSQEEKSRLQKFIKDFDDYKIYGFLSMVMAKDDFLFDWLNQQGKELFLAIDVISLLKTRGPPSLLDEYLVHPILCSLFGHYAAISIQQHLFPQHYPNKKKLAEQDLKNPYKGKLGRVLREIINRKTENILISLVKFLRSWDKGGLPDNAKDLRKQMWEETVSLSFSGKENIQYVERNRLPAKVNYVDIKKLGHVVIKGRLSSIGRLELGRPWPTFSQYKGADYEVEMKDGWPLRIFLLSDYSARDFFPIIDNKSGEQMGVHIGDIVSKKFSQYEDVTIFDETGKDGSLNIGGGRPGINGERKGNRPWAKLTEHPDERVNILVKGGIIHECFLLESDLNLEFSLVFSKTKKRYTTSFWGSLLEDEINQLNEEHQVDYLRTNSQGLVYFGGLQPRVSFGRSYTHKRVKLTDIENPTGQKAIFTAAEVIENDKVLVRKELSLIYEVKEGSPPDSFEKGLLFDAFEKFGPATVRRPDGTYLNTFILTRLKTSKKDGVLGVGGVWGHFSRFPGAKVEATVIDGEKGL